MSDAAKAYLRERNILHLFESMLSALMYLKPDDHIAFIQECLNRAKNAGDFTWKTFVADMIPDEGSSKTSNNSPQQSVPDLEQEKSLAPLPPIAAGTPGEGDRGDKGPETSAQPVDSQPKESESGGSPQPLEPQSGDSESKAPVSAENPPQMDESAELQKLASKLIIFVIGGPGSGKGTHCSRIMKDFGFTHLSAGDLLRREENEQIQEIMKKGLLVPPETIIGLLKTALLSNPDAVGFLIDGFPRDLGQGKLFVEQVRDCSLVLMFECSDDVMVRRVLERGKTSGRVDDNEETMRKRLENFHKANAPILEHYQSMGKVRKINSNRSIDEVYADVHAVLNEITTQGSGDTSLATPTQLQDTPTQGPPAEQSAQPVVSE